MQVCSKHTDNEAYVKHYLTKQPLKIFVFERPVPNFLTFSINDYLELLKYKRASWYIYTLTKILGHDKIFNHDMHHVNMYVRHKMIGITL